MKNYLLIIALTVIGFSTSVAAGHKRVSYTNGTNWWLGYFFVVSMIFAFIFMPVFEVKI